MDDNDEIADLRRQLREERERADAERQRADRAEHQSRPTTLTEYIGNCHRHLDLNVTVESDKSLTSKGSTTNPQNKYLPSKLAAWPDFLHTQRTILGQLHSTFPADKRVFESLGFLQGLGERLTGKKVASERDLEFFQHTIVEDPVSTIVKILRCDDATRRQFNLANGIVFDNHPNVLNDGADEPMARRAAHDPNQLRADQVCVYRHDEADSTQRTLAFVVEYKPPHKLTLSHLRLGLREMDIQKEVVNRATIPTAPEALFQYHADRIVAAAVAQTYHYMITGGLEYSYLTTGEAFVFFRIDWANPDRLLFHLAEPRLEVDAHTNNATHCTAVSQVLAFTLLALTTSPRGQDARHQAMEQLEEWQEDYEAILRRIPVSERKQTPPPSAFEPRTYRNIDRSPYVFRPRASAATCRPTSQDSAADESPDQSDDDGGHHDSPSLRLRRRAQQPAPSTPSNHRQGAPGSSQLRQYCTQRCLLGLVERGPLDHGCPNVLLHQESHPGCTHHPVDSSRWLHLLQDQLAQSLDKDVVKLGKQGARGVAFQVTLAAYGYTVIAKGTVPEFVEDLVHEGTIYETLKPLQGAGVPVFLGAISLKRPYEYDHRVRLVHMMLLSWAGNPVTSQPDLAELLGSIRRLGVTHGDVRTPNIFWCCETNRPMLIDFERATLVSSQPLMKKARSSKRLKSGLRGHRRSQSADNTRQLQQIVLNGGVRRPFWEAVKAGEKPTSFKALVSPSRQQRILPASFNARHRSDSLRR